MQEKKAEVTKKLASILASDKSKQVSEEMWSEAQASQAKDQSNSVSQNAYDSSEQDHYMSKFNVDNKFNFGELPQSNKKQYPKPVR